MGGRVLLVSSARDAGTPADTTRHLAHDLVARGLEVELAAASAASSQAAVLRPDLLVLEGDERGVEVVRALRGDPLTAWLPIVVLTPCVDPASRALLIASGADDVVTQPYDTLELVARVEGILRRSADIRSLSPLTGLPGNHRIEVEVAARAASGLAYAVCHVDLDEFKGFNDAYGFQRGDGLLLLLAACLQRAVLRAGDPQGFLGHIGGDDFVVVCLPEQAETIASSALEEFARLSPAHYDLDDAERGHLETVDRRGERRRTPLVTVSVGIAVHRGGRSDHHRTMATATEMKAVAKREHGSYVAVDRRI